MNLDDFKITTRIRKLNLFAQVVLGVSLYLGLNYVAARHYARFDFSESRRNSLSPESVAYIKNLKTPIDLYVVVSTKNRANENMSVLNDLRLFLNQYAYESKQPNKISVKFVDATRENLKTEDLVKRFGQNIDNCVIVSGKLRYKIIPISDFYTIVDKSKKEFNGESLMSSAILSVSSPKQSKIYFTRGHGEADIFDTNPVSGLSSFSAVLQSQNFRLEPLEINRADSVPSDADMLVIAAPNTPFSAFEVEQIRKYLLKSNGRVVVFLKMGGLRGLDEILYEWGLRSDNMLVVDSGGDFKNSDGDLIARTFPQKSHPIVKYLIATEMPVQFGSARPVRPDMGAPEDALLKLDYLILSSPSSWAEKAYGAGGYAFDDSTDLRGPVPLAMVASRTGSNELGLAIPGGKLAVFGDETFVANKWFNHLGNSILAINTINWMFDDGRMLNIPPRKMKTYSLTVSSNQYLGLALRLFALPCAILALGMTVSFVRRN